MQSGHRRGEKRKASGRTKAAYEGQVCPVADSFRLGSGRFGDTSSRLAHLSRICHRGSWAFHLLLPLEPPKLSSRLFEWMGDRAMRKVSLISMQLVACGLLFFSVAAAAQEPAKPAKAAPSPTPTIDQSLEWNAVFNPKMSPDGKRVVYELQK